MYDERTLHSVEVGPISAEATEDGTWVTTSVHVNLSSIEGSGMGPGIDVRFSFPASPDAPLGELQEQAVERGHAMVQRIARESLDDLLVALKRPPDLSLAQK